MKSHSGESRVGSFRLIYGQLFEEFRETQAVILAVDDDVLTLVLSTTIGVDLMLAVEWSMSLPTFSRTCTS